MFSSSSLTRMNIFRSLWTCAMKQQSSKSYNPSICCMNLFRSHDFSSVVAEPNTDLKSRLRQFYFKVHPDRFDNLPIQKETNTQSFAELSSYVDAVYTGELNLSRQMTLTFWLHQESNSAPSNSETNKESNVRSITVNFSPPFMLYHAGDLSKSSRVTLNARNHITKDFSRLFSMSNIPSDFTWTGTPLAYLDDYETAQSTSSICLGEFLRHARTSAVELSLDKNRNPLSFVFKHLSARLRASNIRLIWQGTGEENFAQKIQCVRQWSDVLMKVDVFKKWIQQLELESMLKALTVDSDFSTVDEPTSKHNQPAPQMNNQAIYEGIKLAAQIIHANNPLHSLIFVFDSSAQRSHLDGRGRIILAISQPPAEWLTLLSQHDICNNSRDLALSFEHLSKFESFVCSICGFGDLWCENALIADPLFRQMLGEWHSDSFHFEKIWRLHPYLKDQLKLRVVSAAPTCFMDPESGILLIPIGMHSFTVSKFIEENGLRAYKQYQKFQQEGEVYSKLILNVKRKLQLRGLTKSSAITTIQMSKSCQRLLEQFGDIRSLLHGMNVIISDHYQIHENGNFEIEWNWTEPIKIQREDYYSSDII